MENKNQTYGLTVENPVIVTGVDISYSYLDVLMTVHSNLSYRRIKSMHAPSVNGILDKYEIFLNEKHYSFLFIYPYAAEDNFTISETFKALKNQN